MIIIIQSELSFGIKKTLQLIEFSLNYTKLATLAIKAYMGKIKINSTKYVGIESVTLGPLAFYCHAFLTELTWHYLQN